MSLYAFILLSTLLVTNIYFTYLCPGNSIPTTNSLYNAWEQLSTNALLIFDYPVASSAVVFRSYWIQLAETKKHDLRLYHIKFRFLYSTDEYLKRSWFVSLALKWKPLLLVLFTTIFSRPTTILSTQCLLNESHKIWLCVYFEYKTKIFPTISKKKAINNCISSLETVPRQKNNK